MASILLPRTVSNRKPRHIHFAGVLDFLKGEEHHGAGYRPQIAAHVNK